MNTSRLNETSFVAIVVSLLFAAMPAHGLSEGDDVFYSHCGNRLMYTMLSNGSLEVTSDPYASGQKPSGAIVIPSEITVEDQDCGPTIYGVSRIAPRAFEYCSATSVSIPDSVTEIGFNAFSWGFTCSSPLVIPSSVTSIGDYAFEGSSPIAVVIPDSVISLGAGLFQQSEVQRVSLPSFIDEISHGMFNKCKFLIEVVLPRRATVIDSMAFYGCSSLRNIDLPPGLKRIGASAFLDCSKLERIDIPSGTTAIGNYAFGDCSGLKTVTIPDSVTDIGVGAFYGCSGLTSVEIPDSVKTTAIPTYLFQNCSSLRRVVLPLGFKGKTDALCIPDGCTVVFRGDSSSVTTYTVKFAANGGDLPAGQKMSAQKIKVGVAAKLRANVFVRSGYVFLGWSKTKAGAVAFKNAASVKNLAKGGQTVTLYAQWAKKSYKVAFYANGGKGKMSVEKFTYGKAKRLSANKFKKKGYVFKGWAKSKALAKKGKVAYKNKKSVKNLVKNGKTVKLYAVWKKTKK